VTLDPYSVIPGWATIVEVREPDARAYNLQDAVAVVFDFEPDEESARAGYAFPQVADAGQFLTVGAGANPTRAWASRMGLVPGSRHRCFRRELRRGTTTPVVFDFPDVKSVP
jgi:hypothetical protein